MTMTGAQPKTVAAAKREIHRLRAQAEWWARERDLYERLVLTPAQKGIFRLLTPEGCRKNAKTCTQYIIGCLTAALHLEYRLPENREPVEKAAEWWGNLERLAAEAREAELRETRNGAGRPRPADAPNRFANGRPVRYWQATVRCLKSGEESVRFYCAANRGRITHIVQRQLTAKEVTAVEEIDKAAYEAGSAARGHGGAHAAWN